MKDGKIVKTGYFLVELAKPLMALIKAGFTPIFATPLGNDRPNVDPMSDSWIWFGSKQDYDDAKVTISRLSMEGNFARPRKLSTFTEVSPFHVLRVRSSSLFYINRRKSTVPMRVSSFLADTHPSWICIRTPTSAGNIIDAVSPITTEADPTLRILGYFHGRRRPTAAICHGPAGLLSAGITNVDAGQPNRPTFAVYSNWIYNVSKQLQA